MSADRPAFVTVATADVLTDDGIHACSAGSLQLLLCRSGGQWHAVAPWCTHAGAPLAGGRIVNGKIVCPLHGAVFELSNGAAAGPPAFRALRTYPLRVVDGRIEVVT